MGHLFVILIHLIHQHIQLFHNTLYLKVFIPWWRSMPFVGIMNTKPFVTIHNAKKKVLYLWVKRKVMSTPHRMPIKTPNLCQGLVVIKLEIKRWLQSLILNYWSNRILGNPLIKTNHKIPTGKHCIQDLYNLPHQSLYKTRALNETTLRYTI